MRFFSLFQNNTTIYDVFISHNRQDKRWARRFDKFLREHNVKVFLDESAIEFGVDFEHKFEGAITASKFFIVILSPAALASPWVRKEIEIALKSWAKRGQPQIIPIQLEDIDMDRVNPALRPISWVDLRGTAAEREPRFRKLLERIGVPNVGGISQRSFVPLISMRQSALHVADIKDVMAWGWDEVRLLEELVKFDKDVNDVTHIASEGADKHEGSAPQWAPIFRHHPDTWRMLISERETIAGYWHIAPLFDDDYQKIKSGLMFDSEITVDRIKIFELPGLYDVYLSQVCMLPDLRKRPGNIQFLFETFFDVLDKLSEHRIYITEVTANAVTEFGEALCKHFKMPSLKEDQYGGKIYAAPIQNFLGDSFADIFPELRDRYAAEGLYTPIALKDPSAP